ncbi:cyclin-dependent kinase 2-associated protein 2 [Nilaparvata lugens]|uniref:cyclin-dependent kinase 2-associated protein 2 n=1 Tax=Nilaparvata lugens TaxID=108931 RepID=UPI00193E73F5|nr:cyclin-dependent kinase 2-associated protein 2 [Nilaparvata lugens]
MITLDGETVNGAMEPPASASIGLNLSSTAGSISPTPGLKSTASIGLNLSSTTGSISPTPGLKSTASIGLNLSSTTGSISPTPGLKSTASIGLNLSSTTGSISPTPGLKSTASIGLQVQAPPTIPKYSQLLSVIEEMGHDIRPTYINSRSSAERLKRCIVHARILVRECLIETERSAAAFQ